MDLEATRTAFDSVAADYDGPRGNNALIQLMRDQLRREILARVPRGSRLLDLGCGTGLDLVYFAALGYTVHGIDLSSEMIATTRRRIERAGGERNPDSCALGSATAEMLAIQHLSGLTQGTTPRLFDAVYSNLGPLNCVSDLGSVRDALSPLLAPRGLLIASVIGRLCPWEIGWYLAARRVRRIGVRFARSAVAVPLGSGKVWTRYFSPSEVIAAFSPNFDALHQRALHVLRPPPYLNRFAERHPRLVDRMGRIEDQIAAWPVVRELGDSFLVVLRLREAT